MRKCDSGYSFELVMEEIKYENYLRAFLSFKSYIFSPKLSSANIIRDKNIIFHVADTGVTCHFFCKMRLLMRIVFVIRFSFYFRLSSDLLLHLMISIIAKNTEGFY
jgi:hypothetical protein